MNLCSMISVQINDGSLQDGIRFCKIKENKSSNAQMWDIKSPAGQQTGQMITTLLNYMYYYLLHTLLFLK